MLAAACAMEWLPQRSWSSITVNNSGCISTMLLAENFKDAMKDGIPLKVFGHDICLRLVPVGVKGDWPFLISVGHLERHFRRAPRGESQLSGYGVCHICCGGLGGIPYEIFSSPPPWESSMQSAAAACPWDLPFIRTCPDFPPRYSTLLSVGFQVRYFWGNLWGGERGFPILPLAGEGEISSEICTLSPIFSWFSVETSYI